MEISLQWRLDPEAKSFFEEAGVAAASLGVTVDLFVASEAQCGLDLMQPLPEQSGGCLYLYQHIDTAAMPQVLLCPSAVSPISLIAI